jgi:hypothetical protein
MVRSAATVAAVCKHFIPPSLYVIGEECGTRVKQQSGDDRGAMIAARHCNHPSDANPYAVVVYREIDETDAFVITAYLALGADVGDGLLFRYDESSGKRVGVTIVGVRSRLTPQAEPS